MTDKYPCQQLLGGTGSAIYMNEDGLCNHPECNPDTEERFSEFMDIKECSWKLVDEDKSIYVTACGKSFYLVQGSPKENYYEWCPYCGRPIKDKP